LKFTVIWQSERHASRDWVNEIFGPMIAEHVYDGKHELVLDNALLVDNFVYARPIDYYTKFRGRNAFLIHFADEFYEKGLEVYTNFRGVYREFWASIFNPKYIMRLPSGYTVGTGRRSAPVAASERTYVWSFLGEMSKASRPDVARELSRVEPHFLFSTDRLAGWTIYNATPDGPRRLPRETCAEILSQSTFAPAPMGNAHTECFRTYEALEAGAIPILEKRLTLDYYRTLLGEHPIPTVRSWREARRLVMELIQQPARLDELQAECMTWWQNFKQSYSREVCEFLMERSADPELLTVDKLASKWGRTPSWRTIELLRHHDTRAVLRRLQRQARRVATTGNWRVAYRRGARPVK
jgi:hypothetical protein